MPLEVLGFVIMDTHPHVKHFPFLGSDNSTLQYKSGFD